jgi:hypothetical protein
LPSFVFLDFDSSNNTMPVKQTFSTGC